MHDINIGMERLKYLTRCTEIKLIQYQPHHLTYQQTGLFPKMSECSLKIHTAQYHPIIYNHDVMALFKFSYSKTLQWFYINLTTLQNWNVHCSMNNLSIIEFYFKLYIHDFRMVNLSVIVAEDQRYTFHSGCFCTYRNDILEDLAICILINSLCWLFRERKWYMIENKYDLKIFPGESVNGVVVQSCCYYSSNK